MKRFVVSVLALMAALLGILATPATAEGHAARPVPKVPLVIDGERLAPEEISRFDGRPLYLFVDQRTPDVLVGYTDEAEARRQLARRTPAAPRTAGEYIIIFSEDEVRGDSHRIPSGTSVSHLGSVPRGCGWFGCAGTWDDVISSAALHGRATFYTEPDFGGGWVSFWGVNEWWFNAATYGLDNVISSLHVHW